MTGTEGKEVFGAKLSSFVAAAFSESQGKRGLYDIFKSAKEKAKYEMGLALQEHDPDVDDVIFARKPDSRGTASRAQNDGTAQAVDDDVRNILRPYGGSMDLLKYLDPLRAAGVINKDELRKLTKERLKEKGIKMKIFHEKELLRRIARANMDFLGGFLSDIGMIRYYDEFQDKSLDTKKMLRCVDDNTLELVGVEQAHRETIMKAVQYL
eukprot:137183_1